MIQLLILFSITTSCIDAAGHNRNSTFNFRNPWVELILRSIAGPFQQDFDPCSDFYCANGGNCTLNSTTPTCQCLGEWTGDRCDVSPCDGYEGCDPGFSCLVDTDSGMRKCSPEENPCDSVTCENGGECLIDYDSQTGKCCCAEGFTGDNCEIEIDACTTNPCENDGTCQVGADDQAVCTCAPDFVGPTCDVDCTEPVVCPDDTTKVSFLGKEKCVFISDYGATSWLQAKFNCELEGFILWEPKTVDEKTAVVEHLENDDYWIGVADFPLEGVPAYVYSGLFSLAATGNTPLNDCLVMSVSLGSGEFQFRDCTTETNLFICEQTSPCE